MASRALLALMFVALLTGNALSGGAYPYSDGDEVIGVLGTHRTDGEESLHEVARDFGLGYNEIVAANPGVDPWLPGQDTVVTIPSRWILPRAAREGIVVNLAEMRLYHYLEVSGRKLVRTYPVGIGKEGFDTPLGRFQVMERLKDPPWVVPPSVKEEKPWLPPVFSPGPENPLGRYAIRLSEPTYLLHGTNEPYGVGRRTSHGCIRLYPEDIEGLYESVGLDESVTIVYQALKIGTNSDTVYLEVHRDYLGRVDNPLQEAVNLLIQQGLLNGVDTVLVRKAIVEQRGIPQAVSTGKGP